MLVSTTCIASAMQKWPNAVVATKTFTREGWPRLSRDYKNYLSGVKGSNRRMPHSESRFAACTSVDSNEFVMCRQQFNSNGNEAVRKKMLITARKPDRSDIIV
jgi:hypothetical protein